MTLGLQRIGACPPLAVKAPRRENLNATCPQVLAAITAGSVAPLGKPADSYFARKEVQARLADAMFNARGSFVTITGAHGGASG